MNAAVHRFLFMAADFLAHSREISKGWATALLHWRRSISKWASLAALSMALFTPSPPKGDIT
ncbi:hypothetical protein ASD60_10150 [Pseudomonas sp. Root562]|nr:hypothetical protein ASD60_10150 [Pseudomonas sp. Root562]